MTEGMRSSVGVAAPPFTKPPYAWDLSITCPAAEVHGLELNQTATMVGGNSNGVVLNISSTMAGTAGSWGCALFAQVTQGTTKNVNGYLDVAELQLNVAGTYNPADMFVLSLQSVVTNTSIVNCSHHAYIAIQDYGTANLFSNLFYFNATVGTQVATTLVSSIKTGATNWTHGIKILVNDTPMWIMATTTTPAA